MIATNVGRGAMDVLMPKANGVGAYGKDVWSRRRGAGVKLCEIASVLCDECAQATEARKPFSGESSL